MTEQELLQELNSKADADLSNSSVPHIIETFSSDDSWYRVYSDGWCEQGGNFGTAYSAYTAKTFNFLKPFKDTNYYASCHSAHTTDVYFPAISEKLTGSVTFANTYNTNGYGSWFACGFTDLGE